MYVLHCPTLYFSWTNLSTIIRLQSLTPCHSPKLMRKKLGQYCKNIGWAMLLCQFISLMPLLRILLTLLRATGEFESTIIYGLLLNPPASTSLPFLFSTRLMQSVLRNWICCIRWNPQCDLHLLYWFIELPQIPNSVPISSKLWLNIDELLEVMWDKLNLVRMWVRFHQIFLFRNCISLMTCSYTKPRGQQPDYSSPVVLQRGKCTVEDFCNAIHKEIVKQFKNGESNLWLNIIKCSLIHLP